MRKGLLCYYSGTGNTELACKCIKNAVRSVSLEMLDITSGQMPDLSPYAVVGFATFTDWWGVPWRFETFMERLAGAHGQPCFVFNTYADHSGQTLRILGQKAREKGLRVIGYHSLRTPGNYSPSVARGKTFQEAPTPRELSRFERFLSALDRRIIDVLAGKEVGNARVKVGLFNMFLREYPRSKSREEMGRKYVDPELCNLCGLCEVGCPYEAIKLDPMPAFDEARCFGCWRCYNRCPQKAVYTEHLRGAGHYPRPSPALRSKLLRLMGS